jgi:hypothetical protein
MKTYKKPKVSSLNPVFKVVDANGGIHLVNDPADAVRK